MYSGLRRRIPWRSSEVSENIPLLENTSETLTEGAEGIELEEFGAEGLFATVEEAGLALDSTGWGAPLGITIGILGALGFGGYEIYQYLTKKNPKVTQAKVSKIINKHKLYPEKHIKNAKKLIQNHKEQQILESESTNQHQYTLPFTKYTGPGNSLNSGDPVNEADLESKIHDTKYANAKNKEDILKADQEYISHQSNILAEGLSGKTNLGNIVTSGIGLAGIGSKHIIEKQLDKVIYPSSFSGKLWRLPGVFFHLLKMKIGIII